MINLLPPELKQEYRYARYNRRLLRWSFAFLGAIIGVVVIAGVGMAWMDGEISKHKKQATLAQTELANQNIKGVQKEVTDISNNLKLMVTVLSKEILFSKLLTQLSTITPSNVILTNLSMSQAQSGVDVTAQAADYNAAAQLQANLADPDNQIFDKADVISINCTSGTTSDGPSNYPCTITIRALFKANNPFLFINNNTQKAGS